MFRQINIQESNSYNLFGIKAYGDQDYVVFPAIDYTKEKGSYIDPEAHFRAYASCEDAIRKHNELLLTDWYQQHRTGDTVEDWAYMVDKGGYGGKGNYAEEIIDTIKHWGLQ